MVSIIVVAESNIQKQARKLVHLLSKNKNIKSVYYNPKMYNDNEYQISGKNYIIFVGKNKVSEDFIPLVSIWKEKSGVAWGYDGSKAIIYIKNSNVGIEHLDSDLKTTLVNLKKKKYLSLAPLAFPLQNYFIVYQWFLFWKNRNKIKEKQLSLGINSFIHDDLEKFISE